MKKNLITLAVFLTATSLTGAEVVRAILPVVGSAQGGFGSNFRTELQLHNRSTKPMSGTLVFHPIGRPAQASDPTVAYALEPHQTIGYDDVVVAFGTSGLGSLDFLVQTGGVPAVVARAFDDRGEEGTSGTTVPAVDPRRALQAGDVTALVLPSDRERFRFNIGVRTLDAGVRMKMIVYGADGVLRSDRGEISFVPDLFIQQGAETLVGIPLLANESIALEIVGGSAIIYGATTDNSTNDPNVVVLQR